MQAQLFQLRPRAPNYMSPAISASVREGLKRMSIEDLRKLFRDLPPPALWAVEQALKIQKGEFV